MDQFILPLVIGIDETWDTTGIHGPVSLSQQVLVLTKKSPIKLQFCQHGIQQHISVIFGGTRKIIIDFEKQSYKYDMILL